MKYVRYNSATGEVIQQLDMAPEQIVQQHLGPGEAFAPVPDHLDAYALMVVKDGEVIEAERPPAPDAGAAWIDRRWVSSEELAAIDRAQARGEISRLEAQQARALREMSLADAALRAAIGSGQETEALESAYAQAAQRLAQLDADIRTQRGIINGTPA